MSARSLTIACITVAVTRLVLSFEAKAWQNNENGFKFPEADLPNISSKPKTGISFSGGGSRSYIASLGYLSALRDLDLIDNIRYIVGVSGGSWATIVYSYFQNDDIDDDTLLGPIISPSDIVYGDLKDMADGCARGFQGFSSSGGHIVPMAGKSIFTLGETDEKDYKEPNFDLWSAFVQYVYLDPSGIERGIPFTLDDDSLQDLRSRNPTLSDASFYLLRKQQAANVSCRSVDESDIQDCRDKINVRPVPIVGSTLIGPSDMEPFTPDNRNYSILEFTPLSAGVAFSLKVVYKTISSDTSNALIERKAYRQDGGVMFSTNHQTRAVTVGGLVEPFCFGGSDIPTEGLPAGVAEGILSVPPPTGSSDDDLSSGGTNLDLNFVVSASSFYSGCAVASLRQPIAEGLGGSVDYWAPAAEAPAASGAGRFAIGDGGGLQISNMVSLLQRDVDRVVLFCSSSVPLQPASAWNPAVDDLHDADIDFSIPLFFGQIPTDIPYSELVYYEVSQSQVFPAEDWVPLAQQLQQAQTAGHGIVVTTQHTTVNNEFYGIPAGKNITVTWVYLGRASSWESQLSREMQALVVPLEDADNMAHLREAGPFERFPNYATSLAGINHERANLLADLAGWTLFQNADQLRSTLQ